MSTTNDSFSSSIMKARQYGIGEFLEIMSELAQESEKKGVLGRKEKELITLGMALCKGCHRCIKIHTKEAERFEATHDEIEQIKKIHLFISSSPKSNEDLWSSWKNAWHQFVLINGPLEHYVRELVALGIALVKQSEEHIILHAQSALSFSAKPTEIFEVMPLALLMDGAPAISQIPVLTSALPVDVFNQ